MKIEKKTGDILESDAGVICQFVGLGGGTYGKLTERVKARYPDAYECYEAYCAGKYAEKPEMGYVSFSGMGYPHRVPFLASLFVLEEGGGINMDALAAAICRTCDTSHYYFSDCKIAIGAEGARNSVSLIEEILKGTLSEYAGTVEIWEDLQ